MFIVTEYAALTGKRCNIAHGWIYINLYISTNSVRSYFNMIVVTADNQ